VQFMPAVVFPQLLLCGLLTPRHAMDAALRTISDLLPLTYAIDAMQRVTRSSRVSHGIAVDLGVVSATAVAALVLGAATLRRRSG